MYEKIKVLFVVSYISLIILLPSALIPSFYLPILTGCKGEYPENVDLPPPQCPRPHFSVLSEDKILVEKNWGDYHPYPLEGDIVGYLVDLTSETVNPVECDIYSSFIEDIIEEQLNELLPDAIFRRIFLKKGKVYAVSVTDKFLEIRKAYESILEEKFGEEKANIIGEIYNKSYKKLSSNEYSTIEFFARVSEVEIPIYLLPISLLGSCGTSRLSALLIPCNQEKIKIKSIEVISRDLNPYFDIHDIDVWGDSFILIAISGDVFLYRKGADCYVNNLLDYYNCQAGKKFGDPMYEIPVQSDLHLISLIGENEVAGGNKIFRFLDGRVISTEIDIEPISLGHGIHEIGLYFSGVNYLGVKDGRYYVVNRRERRYYPLSTDISRADISKEILFAEDEEGNLYAQIMEDDDNCIATIFKVVKGTFIPYVKVNLCEEKIMEIKGRERR